MIPLALSDDVDQYRGYTGKGLRDIVSRLRGEDIREFAVVGAIPDNAFDMAFKANEVYTVFFRGEPAFIWGTYAPMPNLRQLFGFGTIKTPRVIPALSRWGRNTWLPRIFDEYGVTRIEVRVPTTSEHSVNWLTKMGMRIECALKHVGVQGDDFFQLAYTRDDYVYGIFQPTKLSLAATGTARSYQEFEGSSARN
jgi:hypothetical protein